MVLDHDKFVELHAAEMYIAGELPPDIRDSYEEHFFTCAECAEEVRWEKIFAANAKAAFEQQIREPLLVRRVFARDCMAQPLNVPSYQRLFTLCFDVPVDARVTAYHCEIIDEMGGKVFERPLEAPDLGGEIELAIPANAFPAGLYEVVMSAGTREIGRCRFRLM